MEIENARLLTEIAHRGSFAEVARDRSVDLSSVSRTVSAIESELGFRIFQRTTRRVVLTEAGEIYLRRIEAIVEDFDSARDDALAVSAGPAGRLRMTATVAFGQKIIVRLIPRFRETYPAVDLDLILSDANLDLVTDGVDLAVRLGAQMSGDLVVTRLRDTTYRVCASPSYLARAGRPNSPRELSGRDCLRFALPGFRTRWLFRKAGQERRETDHEAFQEAFEVPVQGSVVVSGALALHELALAGMGPTLLGDWLVDEDIAAGRLVDLFPDYQVTATTFETAVWLIYPSRSFLPLKVRAMIDFLKMHGRGAA
jgi:DNA-binding transcriptional LysR family regulator